MSPLPIGEDKLVYASMKSDTIVYVDANDSKAPKFLLNSIC